MPMLGFAPIEAGASIEVRSRGAHPNLVGAVNRKCEV